MATNDSVIQALARLDGQHDFNEVVMHLTKLQARAIEKLAVASDPMLIGRAQGEYQAVSDLLKLSRDARQILAKRG